MTVSFAINRISRRLRLIGCAGVLAASMVALMACSLGDGVTTDCDPNAAPSDTSACHQVSACDDGDGFVKPEQGCCEIAAERQFGLCAETNSTQGKFASCQSDMSADCCTELQQEFNACMAGKNPTGGGGTG